MYSATACACSHSKESCVTKEDMQHQKDISFSNETTREQNINDTVIGKIDERSDNIDARAQMKASNKINKYTTPLSIRRSASAPLSSALNDSNRSIGNSSCVDSNEGNKAIGGGKESSVRFHDDIVAYSPPIAPISSPPLIPPSPSLDDSTDQNIASASSLKCGKRKQLSRNLMKRYGSLSKADQDFVNKVFSAE